MKSHITHARSIRAQLLADMKTGEYAQAERLPRESVLALRMGISRTQLRDVLASLEREGFITRRHGVGTIINRHVLNVQTRMDIEIEFLDMIRQSGFDPAVDAVWARVETADETVCGQLGLPAGTEVLRIARMCTASGRPAVYCEDVVERSRVAREYSEEDLRKPIFHFLGEVCGLHPYLDLTDLRAVAADGKLSELFQVPVGTPLLRMDEVDYDIDGRPVFCSTEFFADGIFRHTVMRKKL